jgi:hypothetical protein
VTHWNRRTVAVIAAWLAIASAPAMAAEAWLGTGVRVVALGVEQRRTGLDGVDAFYGAIAGWSRGRLSVDGELLAGAAEQELGITGLQNPRLAIWWLSAGAHVRPLHAWPVRVGGRVGLWHLDYRDERVTLAFPGIEPIDVELRDFDAPVVSLLAGSDFPSFGRLRIGAEVGLVILRLNETRLEGDELSVVPRWRGSPMASIGVGYQL